MRATIQISNQVLACFSKINQDMLSSSQTNKPIKTVTFDVDNTLIVTHKTELCTPTEAFAVIKTLSLRAEQDDIVYSKFRYGNVSSGSKQL